jgi:uncharacterized protein DUF5916
VPRGVRSRLVPYATGAAQRFLDQSESPAALRTVADSRVGVDAKVTLGSDWMIDATVNPDFSQIESDEPQVTVNQRYEVYFPEKRPFFTDRSNFFTTPEPIFFSRRIVDPRVGGRATGTIGAWTIGALVSDDRATSGDAALVGVMRAQRGVGVDSTVGVTVTNRRDGLRDDAMFSADARLKLNANWILTAQAMRSSRLSDGGATGGTALLAEIRHAGRHLTYYSNYRDRSPEFRARLGYIPRVDMRQLKQGIGYKWRPEHGRIVSIGPSAIGLVNWSHDRTLQEASIDTPFWIDLKGPASVAFGRREAYERFDSIGFRRHSTYVYYSSHPKRWLGVEANWASGTGINYYPADGLLPFVGRTTDRSAGVTWRPASRLLVSESYLDSELHAPMSGEPTAFDNHVARLKSSYQFTKELSLRAIVDTNFVSPAARFVAIDQARTITFDILATYMLHPGTALYVGFTDRRENLAFDRDGSLRATDALGLSTGRQLFVKVTDVLPF